MTLKEARFRIVSKTQSLGRFMIEQIRCVLMPIRIFLQGTEQRELCGEVLEETRYKRL